MYLVQINLFVIISWYEKWVLLHDIIVHVNVFQQLKTYQNISVNLGLLDIEDIVTETGCKVPCRYTEYSLPTSSVDTYILDNETTFGILMASKKVEKRTQIMMYPFPSFVSESGEPWVSLLVFPSTCCGTLEKFVFIYFSGESETPSVLCLLLFILHHALYTLKCVLNINLFNILTDCIMFKMCFL